MQTTTALYKSIFASEHRVEWKVVVNATTTYGQDVIVRSIGSQKCLPKIVHQTFSDNEPSVGNCVAGVFTVTLLLASSAIPRMATIQPYFRLCSASQNSEWKPAGKYFVDTRKEDEESGTLALECYDAILKLNGVSGKDYAELTANREESEWPIPMADVVTEIAGLIEVDLDSRNVINSGDAYMVNYPNDYTMREVMGFIAAAHGANWSMTPVGKLRLIPLTGDDTDTMALGSKVGGLSVSPAFAAWSKVILYWADEDAYESGDDTGRSIEADDPWAEQETADGILTVISGTTYQPYAADNALIDPALELGDKVTFTSGNSTVTAHVWTLELDCDDLAVAYIDAPGEEEVDHEYPYATTAARIMKRMVKLGQPYYGVTISKKHGLEIKRSDGQSETLLNSDVFAMRAMIDGTMKDRLYFDVERGDFVFDGALGAEAVFTDSLYAERGDVAELTVDRVSTSKRIRKYLLRDTSDDNFILIQDRSIKHITASPAGLYIRLLTEDNVLFLTESGDNLDVEAQGSSSFEVAKNRYGQNLYWEKNIENAEIDTDGYPFIDGKQVYVTTQNTGYPVYVYQYTELVKAEYSFVESNGTYVPVQIWGAGSGYSDYGKGFIEKLTNMFQLSYKTRSGVKETLQFNDDGWVDINSLRKPLQFNFTNFDSGSFTETIDGGTTVTYSVTFDAQGRVASIRDGAGHLTEVIW